ncbi:MAG TPA: DUF503 domain-containing protein [bacterium]|nr:DUF503 domain-containing protein [bacterium]
MVVGTCKVTLYIPDGGSLKEKRLVLRRIKDRVRNKFNVSVAEVDDCDLWQRSTLGIATVSKDKVFANQVISSVLGAIEANGDISVINVETEFEVI